MGNILNVDLSKEKIETVRLEEGVLRKYLGGTNLAIRMLYDMLPQGYDGLDPQSPLIFMTGPLVGTAVPGAYYSLVFKSPLSGFTGVAHSKGFFPAECKFAGFDGIVVKGKAEKPVYLWVHDGEAEIRDAKNLWGKDTYETEEVIRKDHNDNRIRVACIGPAGESVALTASVMNDRGHAAARSGGGAVMGSKRLKAIAVRGDKKVPVKDAKRLLEIRKKWMETVFSIEKGKQTSDFGTMVSTANCEMRHAKGDLPVKNLTTAVFGGWKNLSGEYWIKDLKYPAEPKSCFGCFMGHDKEIKVPDGKYSGTYVYPEYEDTAAWGSNLGIDDPAAVIMLTDLANRYGFDSIEMSFTLSLAMECYEKGLIDGKVTEGIDLSWGNVESVVRMMEKVVKREGFGAILAGGVKRTAEEIGAEADNFAVLIKNMSPMLHDIRSSYGFLLGYTLSGAGPTHEGTGKGWGWPDELRFSTKLQAPEVRGEQLEKLFSDSVGVCTIFAGISIDRHLEALSAVTGWDISRNEAETIGERGVNLIRSYNIRNGLTPCDDWPSPRLLEPPPDGGAKGAQGKYKLKGMILDYYRRMGWDEVSGKPWRNTLTRLGLEDVARDLWG